MQASDKRAEVSVQSKQASQSVCDNLTACMTNLWMQEHFLRICMARWQWSMIFLQMGLAVSLHVLRSLFAGFCMQLVVVGLWQKQQASINELVVTLLFQCACTTTEMRDASVELGK